jgi:hypothetical protein
MAHLIPTAYGLMLGAAIGIGEIGGAGGLLFALLSTAGGWGIGRTIWQQLRARSARRVDQISDAISRALPGPRKGE